MLDGLAPFPVSFQHRDKFFLGALVVLKGAGSFAAHRFNYVGVLVLTGEIIKAVFIGKSLNYDCEHFLPPFIFEPTLSSAGSGFLPGPVGLIIYIK